MITYMKSSPRVQNYNNNKQILTVTNLDCFEAIDAINEWDTHYQQASERKTHEHVYLNDNLKDGKYDKRFGSKGRGELGCDLSHLYIYQEMLSLLTKDHDYCLILEDDAIIEKQFNDDIVDILDQARALKSDYVHLACNDRFKNKQYSEKHKLTSRLYKMIPQWHTTCQLVSRRGAKLLLDQLPMDVPIDLYINNNIEQLCATSSPIESVKNGGTGSANETDQTHFGSLIWGLDAK